MADKSIVELGVAQQMTDDALLPVYQGGETKAIEGAEIKQYARESTKQYVEGAAQSAQDAAASAAAAKTAREGVEAYAEQAGQSATQAAGSAKTAQDAATSAEASRTAAAGSATAAQKSAGEAKASETAAGLSETNAGKSATAAQTAKTASEAAQKAAEAAKAAAESSATLAGDKAAEAGQKATEADGSATAAAASATAAAQSKTDAEAAKTAAQTAQSAAEKAKTASETAKTAAQTAQGKAESARDAAGVSAASAANAATAANSSATAAAGSASSASAQAGEASASAGAAKTSETNAKESETAAGLSADAAEQARQAIEALGVQGVTLAPGSQVAVEKVVAADGSVTLKFSIPQGAKGDQGNKGDQGVSITSVKRTAGTGAAGTTDTYTITLSDGSTSTFAVYNGRDGEGAGDMLANVYDPQGKNEDIFAYADLKGIPVFRAEGNGSPYIGTIPGVATLTPGLLVCMIPNVTCMTANPSLDLNGLGSNKIWRYISGNTNGSYTSFRTGPFWNSKPVLLMYEGAGWLVLHDIAPNAEDLINKVPITSGGTGLSTVPIGSMLMGNGIKPMVPKNPAEVLEHIGAVPKERTVNGKPLTEDISLGAGDVAFADGETFQQKLDVGELTGADGAPGKSAYQQAIEAGYTGTEAAFYAALVTLKDAPFLPLAGGTMTGLLEIAGKPDGYPAVYLGAVRPNDEFAPFGIGNHPDGQFLGAQITFSEDCFIEFYGSSVEFNCGVNLMTGGSCSTVLSVPEAIVNKDYVDKKALVFTGKSVDTTAWAADTIYSAQGYGFRASIACTGVTTSHRPDVAFSAADAVGGNFAPVADSYAGGVYIYCKTKPTATVTIPSIVCIKGA